MDKKIKKIGIDARFYGPVGKGLGRYTQEVVDNVIDLDKENKYYIFLTKENYDLLEVAKEDKGRVIKVLADVRWYTFKEQLVMPRLIHKHKLDLIHFPHFNVPLFVRIPFVVTIHDLILFRFPTVRASTLSPFVYKLKNAAYRLAIKNAVKRALAIIAVSQFTKNDILKVFNIKADKVKVIYEGVAKLDKPAKKAKNRPAKRYNIEQGQYLLYVGNVYPHKNLNSLLKAYIKIRDKKPDIKLVLVGKRDYFYKRLMDTALAMGLWQGEEESPVIFAGYVPDKQLKDLYRDAACYVFPSLYEGFGLPPLEAMAEGAVVASSDRGSLPEILGDAALYFNPEKPKDMAETVLKLLDDKQLQDDLRARGKNQVKKYDWQNCAEETLKVYKKHL